MDRIKRVLAAQNGLLLNEVTALRDRRAVLAGWAVTSPRRPELVHFQSRAAAERYFRDEVRRARGPRADRAGKVAV